MATIGVVFNSVVQEFQELGEADDDMVTTVQYALTCDGEFVGDFSSRIKQTLGASPEMGTFEVEPPEGYDGPFSLLKFAQLAEDYYRRVAGSGVHGFAVETVVYDEESYSAQFTAEGECHVVHG